jgi:hypothetical protein
MPEVLIAVRKLRKAEEEIPCDSGLILGNDKGGWKLTMSSIRVNAGKNPSPNAVTPVVRINCLRFVFMAIR